MRTPCQRVVLQSRGLARLTPAASRNVAGEHHPRNHNAIRPSPLRSRQPRLGLLLRRRHATSPANTTRETTTLFALACCVHVNLGWVCCTSTSVGSATSTSVGSAGLGLLHVGWVRWLGLLRGRPSARTPRKDSPRSAPPDQLAPCKQAIANRVQRQRTWARKGLREATLGSARHVKIGSMGYGIPAFAKKALRDGEIWDRATTSRIRSPLKRSELPTLLGVTRRKVNQFTRTTS